MDHESLVDAVRAQGSLLVEVLETDPSVDIPVPTCEEWEIADLIVHVGAFCGFWTHVLCEGTGRPKTPYPDPPDGPELVSWLRALTHHLTDELAATPGATEVWTWYAPDQSAAFVARRCAHELAVHRYDAQSAHGTRSPIPTDLAIDGIEEIFGALSTLGDRTGLGFGRSLALRCSDADAAWRITMESDRLDVERPRPAEGTVRGDLEVTGTASDLELTLYRRPTLSPVEMSGDYSVLDEWYREFRF